MIFINWLKRIRAGSGFCGFSASSWNKVCNVLETIEGIGCTINKTHSGNGWTVVVDGKSSDTPYPEGVTPGTGDPEDPNQPEEQDPPCGHPGNAPGGGGDTEHPADPDEDGETVGQDGDWDHPGDSPGSDGVTPDCGTP